jgi:hypothetical protein
LEVKLSEKLYKRRAELKLARGSEKSLRLLDLNPDPLGAFVGIAGLLDDLLEEDFTIAIDLLPATAMTRRRLRKKLESRADIGRPSKNSPVDSGLELLDGVFDEMMGSKSGNTSSIVSGLSSRMQPVDVVHRRRDMQMVGAKLLEPDAMFQLQVLIYCQSLSKNNANKIFKDILSAFRMFDGNNEFRVTGFGKLKFFGADSRRRRWWFDHRLKTGYFCPRGNTIVNAKEILGLLKPPTVNCKLRNFVGSGPYLEPAPRDFPIYDKQPGVLPLGKVRRGESSVMVGMPKDEFFFGYISGRTRAGKTETASNLFVHAVTIEDEGALFFNPHVGKDTRVLSYLTAPKIRNRVVDINLFNHSLDARHVGWNLLSMENLGEDKIADRANAISDAIAMSTGYTASSARRTTTIMQNAVTSLLYLGLQLPPDLQPTIFTIPTLLLDEEWREAAVARLPERHRGFWNNLFANMPSDATNPLCGAISRLQTNPVVHATFGTPESTYDPRSAMDEGLIVLAAPPLNDQMVSSLIIQVHIDAARSRADILPHLRKLFWMILDEAQIYDHGVGSRGSAVAELLEQTGGYGVRAFLLSQSPTRLSEATLDALTTNASFLGTHATSADGAGFFSKQWSEFDAKRAVNRLPRFNSIMQPTWHGQRTDPFRVEGVSLEQQWGVYKNESALGELEAAIDKRCRPRTVSETLELIEGHDKKMLYALRNDRSKQLVSTVPEDNPFIMTDGLSVVPINPVRKN